MHKPMKHHRDYDDSNNNNHNIDISSQHDDDTSLVDNLDQGLIELTKNDIMSIKNRLHKCKVFYPWSSC